MQAQLRTAAVIPSRSPCCRPRPARPGRFGGQRHGVRQGHRLAARPAVRRPDGYVDDPSSGGRSARRMLHTYTEINRVLRGWPWPVGAGTRTSGTPPATTPRPRLRLSVGVLGRLPSPTQRATGWRLAHWLQANAASVRVACIIWDGRIWSTTQRPRPRVDSVNRRKVASDVGIVHRMQPLGITPRTSGRWSSCCRRCRPL